VRELYTEIGADMSGRRRRDDGWDGGRPDAQDDRRDPWADDSIGEWGGMDADPGEDADRSSASSGSAYGSNGAAGAYVRNAPQAGKSYAPPAFPSFQTKNGSGNGSPGGAGYGSQGYGDDRYQAGSGQRGAQNGHAAGGYGADGNRDAGYGAGRDTYQGAGYGRNGGGNGGYGRPGYGPGGQGNDSGYGGGAGYAGANGRPGGHSPEFTPIDNDDQDDDAPVDTPRPYGRLSIYTLHEDKAREFDRLAERAAEGVRAGEPDTLVYVIHVVPKAPMQRIIYEIYRDRGAFLSHERQPHIRQFAADRASCVLATNIIDLRLKYAKVAALGGAAPEAAAQPQASWTPRAAEPAPGNDRYAATTQYSSAQYASPQYASPQYSPTQYAPSQYEQTQYEPAKYEQTQYSPAPVPSAAGAGAVATFTPANDRYGADNSQVPTVGREEYSSAGQYGGSGHGAYGAGGAQYGAANSNGYSGGAGYANGGSYSSNGYPSPNGYQGASGYSGDNGYSGANGYPNGSGYSGANGYSDGNGYSNGSGYSGANGYSNGSGYSSGAAGNAGGNGYGAANGYGENGAGSYGGSAAAQYTPRYRELTSGSQAAADADGHAGNGSRYPDGGRESARPQSSDWPPRSDYR
jgi:quinol monooxygenase YgiN